MVRDAIDFSTSAYAPIFLSSATAAAVLAVPSMAEETTRGHSAVSSMRCPRAMTSEGTAEAARAEQMA